MFAGWSTGLALAGSARRRPEQSGSHALPLHGLVRLDFHDLVRCAVAIANLAHELPAAHETSGIGVVKQTYFSFEPTPERRSSLLRILVHLPFPDVLGQGFQGADS